MSASVGVIQAIVYLTHHIAEPADGNYSLRFNDKQPVNSFVRRSLKWLDLIILDRSYYFFNDNSCRNKFINCKIMS